jgi:hypothetical protein
VAIIIIACCIHRQESSSLRQELSQRHSEDSKAALSELASLKDSAMKKAKRQWEDEQTKLLKKVRSPLVRGIQSWSLLSIYTYMYIPWYITFID